MLNSSNSTIACKSNQVCYCTKCTVKKTVKRNLFWASTVTYLEEWLTVCLNIINWVNVAILIMNSPKSALYTTGTTAVTWGRQRIPSCLPLKITIKDSSGSSCVNFLIHHIGVHWWQFVFSFFALCTLHNDKKKITLIYSFQKESTQEESIILGSNQHSLKGSSLVTPKQRRHCRKALQPFKTRS